MKKLNLFLIIVLCWSFFVETLICQPILNWNKIYNYNGHQDYPSTVIVDDSGNVYVVGQTEISNNPQTNFDALILKYNRTGTLEWFRKHSLASWGDDIFIKASLTEEGNIFVTGDMQVGNTLKILNIMYSSSGDTLWTDIQDYGSYRTHVQDYNTYWPYGLRNIFEQDSMYFIVDAFFESDSAKIIILKYNKFGEFLGVNFTEGVYGAPKDILFLSADSSFLFTYSKMKSLIQMQPIVEKIKMTGEKIWEKVLIDTSISIEAIKTIVDKNGNFYSISSQRDYGNTVYYITKLTKNGNTIWNTHFIFKTDYFGSPINLIVNKSDQIRVIGTYQYWDGSTTSENGTFTALYDSSGTLQKYKQQIVDMTIQNYAFPKFDEEENIYIPLTVVSPSTYTDILLVKINNADILEYEKVYGHSNDSTRIENAIDIYLVGEDDFVIAGTEGGIVEPANILTLRYGDDITSVISAHNTLELYYLDQNYPNPFNSSTIISYHLPVSGVITLKIFDVLGKEIATLVNEEKSVGTYEVNWNAVNLPSGIYFYRLQAGSFVQTRKMILMK
jgi:hypothetical protein